MAKKPRPQSQKAAEAAADTLTDQEAAFVVAYLTGERRFSALAAAIAAGLSPENAKAHAWELRRRPAVDAAIRKARVESLSEAFDDQRRFIVELEAIAYSRVHRAVEWDGENLFLVPRELIDDATLAAISEVRKTRNGVVVKFHSKPEALRLLGQARGWLGKEGADDPDGERAEALKALRELMVQGTPDVDPPADP